jgi:hypothetical protein
MDREHFKRDAATVRAYSVRLHAELAAKMERWKKETQMPGGEILRLLVAKAEDIQVVFREGDAA